MTWTTLMPGVYAGIAASGTPQPTLPHPERNAVQSKDERSVQSKDERNAVQSKDVRARQRAHIAARLAEDRLGIAPGERWCRCCGETCGGDGHCERCGEHCPRCDGHYTVLAIAVLKPAEYTTAAA